MLDMVKNRRINKFEIYRLYGCSKNYNGRYVKHKKWRRTSGKNL